MHSSQQDAASDAEKPQVRKDYERKGLEEAARRSKGKIGVACETYGISRAQMYRKLEEHGIDLKAHRP